MYLCFEVDEASHVGAALKQERDEERAGVDEETRRMARSRLSPIFEQFK